MLVGGGFRHRLPSASALCGGERRDKNIQAKRRWYQHAGGTIGALWILGDKKLGICPRKACKAAVSSGSQSLRELAGRFWLVAWHVEGAGIL
ncbi:hypothetical protein IG631_07969 [Alternaria alternata]|nr:hypothetical protein IG631_07969 [Alternaria alternata]